MICPKCSKPIKDDAKFCGHCGLDVLSYYLDGEKVSAEALTSRGLKFVASFDYDKAQLLFSNAIKLEPAHADAHIGLLLVDMKCPTIEDLGNLEVSFTENIHYKTFCVYATAEQKEQILQYENEANRRYEEKLQEEKYLSAISDIVDGQYMLALGKFESLNGYKDSEQKITLCKNHIELQKQKEEERKRELEKQAEEQRAMEEKRAKIAKKVAIVVTPIILIGIVFAIIYNSFILPESKYKNAVNLYDSGDYIAAAQAMSGLDGYKNSERLEADYYFKAEEYEKAAECYNTLPDCEEQYNLSRYKYCVSLYDQGQYEEAKENFLYLDDYEESKLYIERCELGLLRTSALGYEYKFGKYEQDNDSSNGKEDITWIVTKKESNRILLVSSAVLDCQVFDYSTDDLVSWPNTRIRNWLNNSFYNTAFSSDEKGIIKVSNIQTTDYKNYGEGSVTTISNDYVFLMSDDEYEEYQSVSGIRIPDVTDYAKAQDDEDDDIDNGWAGWYTRDQRTFSGFVGYHYAPGDVDRKGRLYHVWGGDHTGGIRPCIWIEVPSK